ncbi:MAG: hypothetical protein R2774_13490 [Saprospiraceae bacterium]
MAKPSCKDCGVNLMGHLLAGAHQRRCTSCHKKWKASFGKITCINCGRDIEQGCMCNSCSKNNYSQRVLTSSNINEMLWYEGKKAWE